MVNACKCFANASLVCCCRTPRPSSCHWQRKAGDDHLMTLSSGEIFIGIFQHSNVNVPKKCVALSSDSSGKFLVHASYSYHDVADDDAL